MDGQSRNLGELRMPFEYSETFGARIRQFLQELFGSRYTQHLEDEITRIRNDHDRTLHDRDVQIASQREEIARLNSKIVTYENTVMPRSSREGSEYIKAQKPKPAFPSAFLDLPPTKSKWEQFQDNYYKAEEAAEKEKEKAALAAKE